MPFSYVGATAVARLMMPAMLFANCFLSSSYSQHKMKVTSAGAIELRGAYTAGTDETVADLGQKISKKFRQLGAFALGKPVMSKPGADIHYCGTLPMSDKSASLPSTSSEGLIFGTAGLYVVDGAVLPSLPAKNPTFSIMANADRIGHIIARDTKF
jgi:choline dehydrogenase-like flavoprotein